MSEAGFALVMYVLGFVGIASIGLLPLRAWQVSRRVIACQSRKRLVLAPIVLMVSLAGVASDVHITARIFNCLTTTYCGPAIGSGWTYLAMLGIVYLIFEVAACFLSRHLVAERPSV